MKIRRFSVWLCLLTIGLQADDVLFETRFNESLDSNWTWLREDRQAWRLSDDGLEIRVQPGNMWGGANNAKNVLVRPLPPPDERPLAVSVRVLNRPTEQYEQVDLVWYYDDSHMVKIGQELVDGQLSIVMGREERDRTLRKRNNAGLHHDAVIKSPRAIVLGPCDAER